MKLLNKKNTTAGVSLLEAIIAITIIGVIGIMMAEVLNRGFRSSNRTQLLGVVKQNGQVALNVIDQTIRKSGAIVCVTNIPTPVIVVQDKEGKYIRFNIVPQPNATTNGYIVQDDPKIQVPIPPGFDPRRSSDLCDFNYALATVSNQVTLTDRNALTGVSVKSGSFLRESNISGFKDVIKVKFVLGSGVSSGSNYYQLVGDVPFETTVQLR